MSLVASVASHTIAIDKAFDLDPDSVAYRRTVADCVVKAGIEPLSPLTVENFIDDDNLVHTPYAWGDGREIPLPAEVRSKIDKLNSLLGKAGILDAYVESIEASDPHHRQNSYWTVSLGYGYSKLASHGRIYLCLHEVESEGD